MEMFSQKKLLSAEIDFWREMIDTNERSKDHMASERMRLALALAERKLLMLEPTGSNQDFDRGDRTSSSAVKRRLN
jgi:hypothetical protein